MRSIRGAALASRHIWRTRFGATICAIVASGMVVGPMVVHLNRLRASDTWLLVYGVLFGIVLTAVLYPLVPDKPDRRGLAVWSVVGAATGFVAGMLASWPATFFVHGAQVTAQGWDLEYQVGGLRSVIEGTAFVSFGMLTWLIGAMTGALLYAMRRSALGGQDRLTN